MKGKKALSRGRVKLLVKPEEFDPFAEMFEEDGTKMDLERCNLKLYVELESSPLERVDPSAASCRCGKLYSRCGCQCTDRRASEMETLVKKHNPLQVFT